MTFAHFKKPALLIISALVILLGMSACSGSDQSPEAAIATENLAKGKAFMEANKDKEGVISIDGGVQYKVVQNAADDEARRPKLADSVKVHYRSFHIDGTELHNTRASEPQTIEIKHAILGFRKVLPLMQVGSKWLVYIPSYLAYSSKGYKSDIAPNETLIYELELMEIIW